MIELDLLRTAFLLGGLVFLGGCYGILYGIGRLVSRPAIQLAGFACYVLQCAITLGIVALSPLTGPWKLVVVVGTLGFLVIPPVTWRFVERTHEVGEHA
jgi:hypothetical protein